MLAVTLILVTNLVGDSVRSQQWMLQALRVRQAQAITAGRGVVVAVIDTGVNVNHVDLSGNVRQVIDLTGLGPSDSDGHGTSMAGLIAAHGHGTGRTEGVLGLAPAATIIAIKSGVLNQSSTTGLVKGINSAIAQHVSVICLAEGGAADSPALRKAVLDAEAADIVIVAAAGNKPEAQSVQYPAAYPGVIAAAGTGRHGDHAPISVTGPQVVLSAPAVDIVSTLNTGGYGIGSGTSASTAIIAGAAALVRSRFPKMRAAEVVHRLEATAIDKGPPGRDDQYGYGIVNLVGALTAEVPPLPASSSPTSSPGSSSSPITSGAGAPTHPTSPAASASRHTATWLPYALGVIVVLLAGGVTLRRRRARQAGQ